MADHKVSAAATKLQQSLLLIPPEIAKAALDALSSALSIANFPVPQPQLPLAPSPGPCSQAPTSLLPCTSRTHAPYLSPLNYSSSTHIIVLTARPCETGPAAAAAPGGAKAKPGAAPAARASGAAKAGVAAKAPAPAKALTAVAGTFPSRRSPAVFRWAVSRVEPRARGGQTPKA